MSSNKQGKGIELKDVIHFYLGCEFILAKTCYSLVHEYSLGVNKTHKLDAFILNKLLQYWSKIEFKIIIHPLSKITEEGMTVMANFSYPNYTAKNFVRSNYDYTTFTFENQHGITCHVEWYDYKSETFIYLLKQGFDLFGLIESNQAIDKTLLP